MSVQLDNVGGYCGLAGNKLHEHFDDQQDKGIMLNQLPKPDPESTYRANSWVATTTNKAELESKPMGVIDQDTWIKARVRGNQYGLRASEQMHGTEWIPVSHIMKPPEVNKKRISPETYNINASVFLSGHSILPPNLGRELKGSKRTLQRATGDLLFTGSKTHNDQTIIEPGGVASGLEGMRLKI